MATKAQIEANRRPSAGRTQKSAGPETPEGKAHRERSLSGRTGGQANPCLQTRQTGDRRGETASIRREIPGHLLAGSGSDANDPETESVVLLVERPNKPFIKPSFSLIDEVVTLREQSQLSAMQPDTYPDTLPATKCIGGAASPWRPFYSEQSQTPPNRHDACPDTVHSTRRITAGVWASRSGSKQLAIKLGFVPIYENYDIVRTKPTLSKRPDAAALARRPFSPKQSQMLDSGPDAVTSSQYSSISGSICILGTRENHGVIHPSSEG